MRQQKKMIVSYDGPQTLSVMNNCSTTSGTAMDVSTNQSIDSIYSRGVSSTIIASGYGTNSMSIYGYTRLSRPGRAIGVWGAGSVLSNSSSQSNAFGVVGGFGYLNHAKGAGIYGTSNATVLQLNQKYAGYFYGPVEVQGNLTVTGSINGVLLSPPASSVSSRSVVFFVINSHNYLPYIIKYDVTTNNIQNTLLSYDAYYYRGTPLAIGYDVDASQTCGNVILSNPSNLRLKKGQGVTIKNGFFMEKGATLTIE